MCLVSFHNALIYLLDYVLMKKSYKPETKNEGSELSNLSVKFNIRNQKNDENI